MTLAQDELAESIFESSDLVRARGSACARSKRTCTVSRLVAVPDRMVTGLAGGDQETVAERLGDEHREESERERRN